MGEKFQVWAWDSFAAMRVGDRYDKVWGGRSLIKAIYYAWVAKGYSGCVKIEWRGTR